jgi:hypothetical protein
LQEVTAVRAAEASDSGTGRDGTSQKSTYGGDDEKLLYMAFTSATRTFSEYVGLLGGVVAASTPTPMPMTTRRAMMNMVMG